MSTYKHIDKICYAVIALALVITILFANASKLGVMPVMAEIGYESRLFDTSRVHTIEIVMDDWEGFLDTCENEEYTACSVVIDNEAYKNVGIRAKGNTSLSSVSAYGNDRYSFKLEFDCYEKGKSYHGLDKISLNNIIQDNTYMKDYLSYQMMGAFGVDAPLCSYADITVNGEEWGLYLAVEAVEESFLARNYGNDYGELYKPDSQSMGGGRGNGGGFRMEDVEEFLTAEEKDADTTDDVPQQEPEGGQPPELPKEEADDAAGETAASPPGESEPAPQDAETNSEDFAAVEQGSEPNAGETAPTLQDADDNPDNFAARGPGFDKELGDFAQRGRGFRKNADGQADAAGDIPAGGPGFGAAEFGEDGGEEAPGSAAPGQEGGMGMGSDDVCLIYSDDEYDSYKNIFENAKTDITDDDKDRLIASLKKLGAQEDLENIVDMEEVIRYFVVHNFVCNFDSYTGSMIHNYYLYEEDGKLSMIPWDYNLAFGGFNHGSSGSASDMVNYPIDSPVSGGTIESRPMLAWIFSEESYTEMYHQYFDEFIESYFESGYFEEMIDSVKEMISPYVEKDPTKFCTYEEFQTGVDTLKQFCLLRAESIRGQLDGTIPSTSEAQQEDPSALLDASDITISDMGTMEKGMMQRQNGSEAARQ